MLLFIIVVIDIDLSLQPCHLLLSIYDLFSVILPFFIPIFLIFYAFLTFSFSTFTPHKYLIILLVCRTYQISFILRIFILYISVSGCSVCYVISSEW